MRNVCNSFEKWLLVTTLHVPTSVVVEDVNNDDYCYFHWPQDRTRRIAVYVKKSSDGTLNLSKPSLNCEEGGVDIKVLKFGRCPNGNFNYGEVSKHIILNPTLVTSPVKGAEIVLHLPLNPRWTNRLFLIILTVTAYNIPKLAISKVGNSGTFGGRSQDASNRD